MLITAESIFICTIITFYFYHSKTVGNGAFIFERGSKISLMKLAANKWWWNRALDSSRFTNSVTSFLNGRFVVYYSSRIRGNIFPYGETLDSHGRAPFLSYHHHCLWGNPLTTHLQASGASIQTFYLGFPHGKQFFPRMLLEWASQSHILTNSTVGIHHSPQP